MAILPYRSPRPSLTKVWAILLQANYCWARRKRSAIYMCHGLHWCQVWVILLPTIFCGLGEKVQPFTCNMDCTCTKICRFGPYFWKPIIAGLGENDQPFICAMDYIGAKNLAKDFVVLCTGRNDYTVLETEELFEAISQALLSSVDCDFLRGWGRYVFIVGGEWRRGRPWSCNTCACQRQ